MRVALITALTGSGEFVVLRPPGVPREISDEFKRLILEPPAEIAEIHLWDSGAGIAKRKAFFAAARSEPMSAVAETPAPGASAPGAASTPDQGPDVGASDESPAEADGDDSKPRKRGR